MSGSFGPVTTAGPPAPPPPPPLPVPSLQSPQVLRQNWPLFQSASHQLYSMALAQSFGGLPGSATGGTSVHGGCEVVPPVLAAPPLPLPLPAVLEPFPPLAFAPPDTLEPDPPTLVAPALMLPEPAVTPAPPVVCVPETPLPSDPAAPTGLSMGSPVHDARPLAQKTPAETRTVNRVSCLRAKVFMSYHLVSMEARRIQRERGSIRRAIRWESQMFNEGGRGERSRAAPDLELLPVTDALILQATGRGGEAGLELVPVLSRGTVIGR
jgi:hypothetical protein